MRKLFLLSIACFVCMACNDEKEGGETTSGAITIPTAQLNRDIYADINKADISFSAAKPWSAKVAFASTAADNTAAFASTAADNTAAFASTAADNTAAFASTAADNTAAFASTAADNTAPWLTLDKTSGEAGTALIKITLTTNKTGFDRQATITILCDGTTVTVTLSQKATTEEGKIPGGETPNPSDKPLIRKIAYVVDLNEGQRKGDFTFDYNDEGRVVGYKESATNYNGTLSTTNDMTLAYKDNTIIETSKYTEYFNDQVYEDNVVRTYMLNADGYVASWSEKYKTVSDGTEGSEEEASGTLTYRDGYLSEASRQETEGSYISRNTDVCSWQEGNMTNAGHKKEGQTKDATAALLYGTQNNDLNIDLNYIITRSEWIECLAFSDLGIKPFGHVGKRSAKLMIKETDNYDDSYHTFEYESDKKGRITHITARSYEINSILTKTTSFVITYVGEE